MSALTIEEENNAITLTLQYLVGSRYVPGVKAYISELTGRPHVFGPHESQTFELDYKRITVLADAAETITGFDFG